MTKSKILYISIPLIAALVGCTKDDAGNKPVDSSNETNIPQESVVSDASEGDILFLVGQFFGARANLGELHFTDDEITAFSNGFEDALRNSYGNEFMQENQEPVGEYLQTRYMEMMEIAAQDNLKAADAFVAKLKEEGKVTFTESGLGYVIINKGESEPAAPEDAVQVTYKGSLVDGTVFDKTIDENTPATFPLNGVIPGFSEGLQLVGKGGEVKLYIPSEIGYGNRPNPGSPIEPGSLLIFEVKIKDIIKYDAEATKAGAVPPPAPAPAE